MGVACPRLSDEPSYTMVESSGGSCRCACQDEFQDAQEQSSGCCSPHVFTSILLGILSCVLMTGGVFLAFHRWDPMWLMVSGVGVVLIIIGTILHCCNNLSQRPKRHSTASKGCCSRPAPPDHGGHIITNNGSLTEQLLPLSNARSVSQLSLNMLPGYFPPVVTAYGIEQHSAVVQNINKLVQQQQQLQQQQAQSPGSISPSAVGSAAGKSFIVLSLPGDATAANIQNLVATVYQLDGNTAETANEPIPNITAPVVSIKPSTSVPLILKNVEVQTCSMWPVATVSAVTTNSGENSVTCRSSSTSTDESPGQAASQPTVSTSSNSGSTQTEDIVPVPDNVNLIDCSTDISPICDNSTNICDNQPADNNVALVDIPASSSADLLDVSLSSSTASTAECVLVDIPDQPSGSTDPPTVNLLVDVAVDSPPNLPEVLVDILENSGSDSHNGGPLLEGFVNSNFQQLETIVTDTASTALPSSSDTLIELPQHLPENTNSNLQNVSSELLSSTSNLSTADTEIDDGELMARSSPPPSYEDVTLEGENVGAFGLAYGTI